MVLLSGVLAVLNCKPVAETSHIVYVWQIGYQLLANRLGAKRGRLDKELGQVRSMCFAGEAPSKEEVRGNRSATVSGTQVAGHSAKLGRRLNRQ